uniref:Uncharacterized protein n=1 Tax=Arion vulgaris TaxID=1028688 RepID=A0A0B7A4P8_9EUPU
MSEIIEIEKELPKLTDGREYKQYSINYEINQQTYKLVRDYLEIKEVDFKNKFFDISYILEWTSGSLWLKLRLAF